MSEHSAEAERVDESAFGVGGESSIDADVAASGADTNDTGAESYDSQGADEGVPDSHASDVASAYSDSDDAPVQGKTAEDGSF
jgi:hypothetical protein